MRTRFVRTLLLLATIALFATAMFAQVVSPSSLTFPATAVGTCASNQLVTFTNNGADPMTVVPSTTGPFGVWFNNCQAALAPGAGCTISVGYVPVQDGAESGTLTFDYTGEIAPATIPLSGTGVGQLVLSTSTLTFAGTQIGQAAGSQTVSVLNRTGASITITPPVGSWER